MKQKAIDGKNILSIQNSINRIGMVRTNVPSMIKIVTNMPHMQKSDKIFKSKIIATK